MIFKSDSGARLVIKQEYTSGKRLLTVLGAFLVLVLISLAYWAGQKRSVEGDFERENEMAALQMRVEDAEKKFKKLKDQVSIYEQDSLVNRRANEQVRKENKRLREKITELEEAVAFYRGVMSPSKNVRGLRIARFELSQTNDEQRFRYKFVLTQVAENSRYIKGNFSFNVIGAQKGMVKSLSHKQLSSDANKNSFQFRFRYFQDFEGEILLPDEFIPERVEVIAESKGKRAVRLEESFNWSIDEV